MDEGGKGEIENKNIDNKAAEKTDKQNLKK